MKTINSTTFYKHGYNGKAIERYRLRKELSRAARLIGMPQSRSLHPTVINEIGKHIGSPKDVIASAAIQSLYIRSLRINDEPTNSRRMV